MRLNNWSSLVIAFTMLTFLSTGCGKLKIESWERLDSISVPAGPIKTEQQYNITANRGQDILLVVFDVGHTKKSEMPLSTTLTTIDGKKCDLRAAHWDKDMGSRQMCCFDIPEEQSKFIFHCKNKNLIIDTSKVD